MCADRTPQRSASSGPPSTPLSSPPATAATVGIPGSRTTSISTSSSAGDGNRRLAQTLPAATWRSRPPPTQADFESYANTLMDIQTFIENLRKILTESTVAGGDDDGFLGDLAANYLAPLVAYQDEMADIRRRVGTARTPPDWLVELIEKIEPECDRAVKQLKQYQSVVSAEDTSPPPAVAPSVVEPTNLPPPNSVTSKEDVNSSAPREDARTAPPEPPSPVQVPGTAANAQPAIDNTRATTTTTTPRTTSTASTTPSNATRTTSTTTTPSSPATTTLSPSRQQSASKRIEQIESVDQGRSIEEWIEELEHRLPENDKNRSTTWRIDRNDREFLQTLSEKYKKAKNVELHRKLEVVFEGERGIDRGALTRELFYMAFEAISSDDTKLRYKDVRLMAGEKGHLLPDPIAVDFMDAYEFIGKMIAHAVRNRCHGLPGLAPAVQAYLVYGKEIAHLEDLAPPVSIDDVHDQDLKSVLTKLINGENLTEDNEGELQVWMERSNCRILLSERTRELIVQNLLVYYTLTRQIRQIDAIAKGMELLGLRKFLQENATKENLAIVFPSPDDIVITPELFLGLVVNRGERFDVAIWEFFNTFLKELADNKFENSTMSDLVRFLTGAPYLPPRIVISFSNSDVMPVAHACYNELQLPTKHSNYASFREKMLDGMAHKEYTLDVEQAN